MHQLRFRITNLAPLIISARYGDNNMVATLRYIPGTSVLGMLAARFIRLAKIPPDQVCMDEKFRNIFLEGYVNFGNAYISIEKMDNETEIFFRPRCLSGKKNREGGYMTF